MLIKHLALALILLAGKVHAETLIANPQTNFPKKLSLEEVRDIFLLKKTHLPNGVRIQIFIPARESLTTRQFILKVLGIPPSSYFSYLDTEISSRRGNYPIKIVTESEVVREVATTPGGIGLVRTGIDVEPGLVSKVSIK